MTSESTFNEFLPLLWFCGVYRRIGYLNWIILCGLHLFVKCDLFPSLIQCQCRHRQKNESQARHIHNSHPKLRPIARILEREYERLQSSIGRDSCRSCNSTSWKGKVVYGTTWAWYPHLFSANCRALQKKLNTRLTFGVIVTRVVQDVR